MDRKVYDTMDLILKTEKLKQLKEVLKEHHKDSRKYLDEFYKDCKEGKVDEMNWVESDNEFSDFVSGSSIEYNRIYDKAILDISNKLLTLLKE